ncbi:carbohydrate sulfotransferase 8-like [Penaeus indicus]|uniref:carbohydrate sulfotransferase 8-like n=1 Tax=Penaeus indicus TaxID=29960 RepID=UPI00300C5FF7
MWQQQRVVYVKDSTYHPYTFGLNYSVPYTFLSNRYWDRNTSRLYQRITRLLLGPFWTIQAMKNSTKVMTVRHPLERLVSAFRDKFQDGRAVEKAQSDGHMRYFWKPAMVALKKGRNEEGKLQITFHEFLQYVVKEQRSSAGDPHWMRLYRLCSVCGIDFPFVMRLETYTDDLAFLVRNLGIAEVNPLERRHSL